ncbi:DUF2130 domain-containing protein [Pseudaestuariivita atlantica]|uniref:DUF2130 domain-containing protein n=1 Tax=Pseudaestuariivita atlantica TaxID=1317121 RepID=A0A0L1JV58_9RHOB|nr:DUF2130 domain-containing protein [Pseudaestuariivita atlantica]KNG95651.1 hypothetical protein ATO11_00725 [Pseudaestuariivita atlantica]
MSDTTITCPHCQSDIALSEQLAGPLLAEARKEFAAREEALAKRLRAEAAAEAAAAQAAELAELKARSAAEAQARAREMEEMRAAQKVQAEQLAAAQKAQAAAIRRERELEERERALDLAVETKLAEAVTAERARLASEAELALKARLEAADEASALKLAEKDQQLEGLRRQLEAAQRRAEKGSQQLQGEAAEVVLEDRLAAAFPLDVLAPVPKGIRGADCVQQVAGPAGPAGAILWESKRTENWSPGWLPKLREDMRAAGADLAVLTSRALPEGVGSFQQIDGVWVTAPAHAIPLASVLRQGLIEVALARGQREGQATKAEMIFDYITGPQFRARVEAVVEKFDALREDLRREQKTMTSLWAKREKALGVAEDAMIGMYGDFQGIAGAAVADIEGLDLPLLEDGED